MLDADTDVFRSLGKLGECAEEPGQDGGGGEGVQKRPAAPRQHGRHAV